MRQYAANNGILRIKNDSYDNNFMRSGLVRGGRRGSHNRAQKKKEK